MKIKYLIESIKSEIKFNNDFINSCKESYLDCSKSYSEAKDSSDEWKETIHNMAMSFLELSLDYEEKNRILENALHELEKY